MILTYDNMSTVLAKAPQHGLVLEFGVAWGNSLREIANTIAPRKCYGFDWFNGLPEAWSLSNGHIHAPAGGVATQRPEVPDNAIIVEGLFQQTLEPFLAEHSDPVAFVHLDADLYSSTKYVLDHIADRLMIGSVVVFDEIEGLQACYEHEGRAFSEFLRSGPYRFQRLAYQHDGAAAAYQLS